MAEAVCFGRYMDSCNKLYVDDVYCLSMYSYIQLEHLIQVVGNCCCSNNTEKGLGNMEPNNTFEEEGDNNDEDTSVGDNIRTNYYYMIDGDYDKRNKGYCLAS